MRLPRRWARGPEEPPALTREQTVATMLARVAAVLFVVVGLVTSLSAVVLDTESPTGTIYVVVGVLAVVAGFVFLVVPWWRWSRRALLAEPLVALALLAVPGESDAAGQYLTLYILIFLFLGLTQPRRWVIALAPVALASFVVGFGLVSPLDPVVLVDFVLVLAIGLVVGIVVATALADQREASRDVVQLFAGTRALAKADGVRAVTGILESTLHELLASDREMTFLGDARDLGRLELVVDLPRAGAGAGGGGGDGASHPPEGGLPRRLLDRAHAPTAATVLGHETTARLLPLLADGEPVLIADAPTSLVLEEAREALGDVRSVLVIPLHAPGPPRASLGFAMVGWARPVSGLSDLAAQAVALLVEETVTALVRERRLAQLNQDALTDPLTGVLNRRAVEHELEKLDAGDVVVVIDLDHLREVNREHGHPAGDRTLRTLAACLVDFCRRHDWCGRLGGEEFVLVVRRSGSQPARAVARLRERWHSLDPLTTFSAGVAVHRADGDAWQTLVQADSAMRRAKELGRDRVEVFAVDGRGTTPPAAS